MQSPSKSQCHFTHNRKINPKIHMETEKSQIVKAYREKRTLLEVLQYQTSDEMVIKGKTKELYI
jgi:hypothetical protein